MTEPLQATDRHRPDSPAVCWHRPGRFRPRLSASLPELYWLLALVIIAAVPHLPHVAGWITMSLLTAALWRLGAAILRWPLPNGWTRGFLAIVGFITVAVSYRSVSGTDAGSALLMIMLGLKLLETRRERDRVVIVLIAWFLLFAAFLREQAMWSIGQLLLGLIIGTGALHASTRGSPPLHPVQTLQLTLRLLLPALPVALLLFLLFPRLPGPLWALPDQAGAARTGLSDRMSPGDISELALSDQVAFRVRFSGPAPDSNDLYWRGPVLDRFDGRHWSSEPSSAGSRPANRDAPAYDYEIVVEPHGQPWLLALDTPLQWSATRARLTGAGALVSDSMIEQRLAWSGRSQPGVGLVQPGPPPPATLELPAQAAPRARALAAAKRERAGDDSEYLAAVLRMFGDQPFYYSLQPQVLGDNPVDEFLFETRDGFCEHYAAAFVVMARAAGIPARVVTGYQGGERNPIGDYWIVRQSHAHAWTEVLLDNEWRAIDPTAAIAPDRILFEGGITRAGGGVAGFDRFIQVRFLQRMALSWDALNATWDRWVLAFGPETQRALMSSLGFRTPSSRTLVLLLSGSLLLSLAVLTAWFARHPRRRRMEDSERLWNSFCEGLARLHRPRRPQEGPAEYARAVATARPDIAAEILAITRLYLRLRYEGIADATGDERLRIAIRGFQRSRA